MTRIHVDRYGVTAAVKAVRLPEDPNDTELTEFEAALYNEGFTAWPIQHTRTKRTGILVFDGSGTREYVAPGNWFIIGGQFHGQAMHPHYFAEHFDPTPLED